jgi:hypothetical protein
MRKLPQNLAMFFLAITIVRVAIFLHTGMLIGWMGIAFAIGIAAGVYVSAFYMRFAQTRLAAILALPAFMAIDLWFNELEVIRMLSTANLIPATANFLKLPAEELIWAMQWAGIAFGAFPTIAACLLGWMQGGAEQIPVIKQRVWYGNIGLAFMAKLSNYFPSFEDTNAVGGQITTVSTPRLTGRNRKTRWEELTTEQQTELPNKTDGQIVALYGGSARRARQWKERIRKGQ